MELNPKGLHLIVADQNGLVSQLYGDLTDLQKEAPEEPFWLHLWGGEHTHSGRGPSNISELTRLTQESDKPVVLVTTVQTLMAQLGIREKGDTARPEDIELLKSVLRHLIYDEVHHSAGELRVEVLKKLLEDNPNVSALGISATPTEEAIALFGDRAFYTYLDKPKNFIKSPKSAKRTVGEAVLQLERAFHAGELVRFPKLKLIAPKIEEDVFIKESDKDNAPYIVNPRYYPQILKAIENVALHRQGIIIVNSEAEAIAMTKAFNTVFGERGRKAETVTYRTVTTSAEFDAVKERFNQGKTHVLISVQKLDEGIDLPTASFYADLNRSIGSRPFLQRVGRTTRIAPNKYYTDVYLLTPKTKSEVKEGLESYRKEHPRPEEKSKEETSKDPSEDPSPLVVSYRLKEMFDRLRETQVETLDFWEKQEPSKFRLNDEEFRAFTAEDGMLEFLKSRFPGISTNSRKLVSDLAELLLETERDAFKERHGNLGSDVIVNSAKTQKGAASKLVGLLSDWARVQKEHGRFQEIPDAQGLTTKAKGLELFGNPPISLSDKEHLLFISETEGMLEFLKARFPGISHKGRTLVSALAELLPETEREDFRKRHGNLGSDQMISRAKTQKSSASKLVNLLSDWAGVQHKHHRLKETPTTHDLVTKAKGMELFGNPPVSLSENEHSLFISESEGMLAFLKARFPETSKNSRKLVSDLAELLPETEREDFKTRHGNLGSDVIVTSAKVQKGSSSKLVNLLSEWAGVQYKHHRLKKTPTTHDLVTKAKGTELFGNSPISLSENEHLLFISESEGMLEFLKARFPGTSKNSRKLVSGLAELLPETEREDFRKRHGNLGFDTIVNKAKAQKGAASKLVNLLSDWVAIQYKHGNLLKLPTTPDLLVGDTGAKLFPE